MPSALTDALRHYTNTRPGPSPFVTEVPGLTILRADHEKRPNLLLYKPALCVVAQGSKTAVAGDRRMEYGAGQALLVSLEMPASGRVTEASDTEPYLGAIVEFDLAVLGDVLASIDSPRIVPADDAEPAVSVIAVEGPVADCVTRLVRLLETPLAIPVVAPAIMRELSYWLLTGPQGGTLARLALAQAHPTRLLHAIHALRDRFAEPVRVEELASVAQLSLSAFHRQFKQLTSMTPLQYQKQLRLIEARRLMLSSEAANAEAAAYAVGYESASQFSREYARMFGSPPRRDVASMRSSAA
jgi:AraC-like DNA-binding protein